MIGWSRFVWKKNNGKVGFKERWRRLMMQCISTVSCAVRINGVP